MNAVSRSIKPAIYALASLCLGASLFFASESWAKDTPPPLVIPAPLGTDIHFRGAPEQELDLLQRSGVKVVRLDFTWYRIEHLKGQYDFSQYDPLIAGLLKRGIRPYCLLGFGNQLYGETMSIRTPAGLDGFSRFAAASAAHYRGQKIIWEIWSEPNLSSFWLPQSNPDEYMTLLRAVVPAIRQADPNALIAAPALSNTVTNFLQLLMQRGLLQLVDALSVHPYQDYPTNMPPESVERPLAMLKSLVRKYAPENPNMPIFFSEWGYSYAGEADFSEELQGNYLARQALLGMIYEIPVNIWYDWKNDRPEPCLTRGKCYGLVKADLSPRPAYYQMQRIASSLGGYRFVKQLPGAIGDYYLVFSNATTTKVAAWTTGAPHPSVPLPDNKVIPLSGKPYYQPLSVYIGQ